MYKKDTGEMTVTLYRSSTVNAPSDFSVSKPGDSSPVEFNHKNSLLNHLNESNLEHSDSKENQSI